MISSQRAVHLREKARWRQEGDNQFSSDCWLFKIKKVWFAVSTIMRNCKHFVLSSMEACENYPRQSLQEKWRISLENHVQQLFPSLKCLLLISWRMVGRCQLKVWFDNLWKILAIVLWQSFSLLSIGCSRMDIFFWFVRAAHY